MGARSQERGQKAIDEMPEGCKGKVELLLVDVGDLILFLFYSLNSCHQNSFHFYLTYN